MKPSTHRRSRRVDRVHQQQRLIVALRAQWQDAPALFNERDDDIAERASLLHDFECAHDEALEAECYN